MKVLLESHRRRHLSNILVSSLAKFPASFDCEFRLFVGLFEGAACGGALIDPFGN